MRKAISDSSANLAVRQQMVLWAMRVCLVDEGTRQGRMSWGAQACGQPPARRKLGDDPVSPTHVFTEPRVG